MKLYHGTNIDAYRRIQEEGLCGNAIYFTPYREYPEELLVIGTGMPKEDLVVLETNAEDILNDCGVIMQVPQGTTFEQLDKLEELAPKLLPPGYGFHLEPEVIVTNLLKVECCIKPEHLRRVE